MSGLYDFYSPWMSAAIITDPANPEGSRFPLWTNDQTSQIDALRSSSEVGFGQLAALSFLTELTVELQLAFLPKITAVLNPPFREGVAFLDSPLIEWGTSLLEVRFGYTGGAPGGSILSPVFNGVILKPEVTIGQDISITLNAQGVGGYTGVTTSSVEQYNGWRRRDIIQQIVVEKLGMEVSFEGNLNSIRRVGGQNHPIEQPVTISQAGLTHWLLLWKLVRESECWMNFVGPETRGKKERCFIFERNSVMTNAPKYILRLFDFPSGQLGPGAIEGGTFPILSVSSPTPAVYLPASTRGFLVSIYDGKEREAKVEVVDDTTTNTGRTGLAQIAPRLAKRLSAGLTKVAQAAARAETGEGVAQASSDSGTAALKQQVVAEYQAAATNMGVMLEIESLGIPDILPGEVVAVRGLGQRLLAGSANFGVFKVIHKVGGSGYGTSLEVRSNVAALSGMLDKQPKVSTALGAAPSAPGVYEIDKPTGPINQHTIEEPPAGSTTVTSGGFTLVVPKLG